MIAALSRPLVKLVERWLPDPFALVMTLTLVVMIAAIAVEGASPAAVVRMWGDGFWGLLAFGMQMVLVLVTGFILASTPLIKGWLAALARRATSPGVAIVMVSLVSLVASWINWGFGLVVGALFAKALARQVKVDYRLLVAAAYSGFVVWHAGLAGSIPLAVATPAHPFEGLIGLIPTAQTLFAPFNLMILAILFVVIPVMNRLMMPAPEDAIYVDPARLDAAETRHSDVGVTEHGTPAERFDDSRWVSLAIGIAGLAWLVMYFADGGGLTLNVVNFLFLFLAIILHGTPRRLLDSLKEAMAGAGGIVIQFPFYAGIMGIMTDSGLAGTISQAMVSLATETTMPFWSFLSAGLVNIFVPSGGGQWAVQAPVVLPAAEALGADMARVTMAVAWGDAWTNMIQPFWALPILGIAGLKARDIMGFCLIHLIVTGIVISIGLTFF
ncbi:short-chain fatty acid transporter [Paracoccus sp. p4-l81]|uniref:short-chain fatty acid transporter n=1 Tax=unclassified Paracoccus (in: a-proteobacteria) TaxID=2688777 RepID=UPI0035BA3246